MAYRDDIIALGADHLWIFDGNSTDQIGSANGTDTGVNYGAAAICLDATNCMETDALSERVTLPTTTTINNATHARKAVGGWYLTTAIQAPPTRIYGEGTNTQCWQFCLGFGNNLMFEVVDSTDFATGLQVYGPVAQPGRAYHLLAVFLDSANGNEVKFFVDGFEQFDADPANRQPGAAGLASRGVGEFGDPAGTTGIGGGVVLQQAARDGRYNHWCAWGDEADADLTDTEVRETLFERGALAEVTVSTDTEANMQTSVDGIADQGDSALAIEVEAVTGGGDFTLTSDVVFDELGSCHVRYNGTADTLTWVNTGTGNASIASAPFGGSIVIANRQTLTVTVQDAVSKAPVENARVYIEADTGGDLPAGTQIMSALTNASGVATATFDYTSDQPVVSRVRKAGASPRYKTGAVTSSLTSSPLDATVLLVGDE